MRSSFVLESPFDLLDANLALLLALLEHLDEPAHRSHLPDKVGLVRSPLLPLHRQLPNHLLVPPTQPLVRRLELCQRGVGVLLLSLTVLQLGLHADERGVLLATKGGPLGAAAGELGGEEGLVGFEGGKGGGEGLNAEEGGAGGGGRFEKGGFEGGVRGLEGGVQGAEGGEGFCGRGMGSARAHTRFAVVV